MQSDRYKSRSFSEWLSDLMVNRQLRKAERMFKSDKELQNRFADLRRAEEDLHKTWDDICRDRKGTPLDCDELVKKTFK
jgi:hypothetical protein